MYGVPTLAILIVLPSEQITSLHGLIDAMQTVFTVYGRSQRLRVVGGAQRRAVHLGAARQWIGMDHGCRPAQAAACQDGGGPRRLGRISERTGVPVVMGLVSGAVSLATMVATSVHHRRRRAALLLRRADIGDLDDHHRLPVRLPGVPRHPPSVSGSRPAVQGPRWGEGCPRHHDRSRQAGPWSPPAACCGQASQRLIRTRRCHSGSRGEGCSSSCWCCHPWSPYWQWSRSTTSLSVAPVVRASRRRPVRQPGCNESQRPLRTSPRRRRWDDEHP